MRYAVVIVNWNGAGDTIDCLASFLYASEEALAIIVDNGSSDDSLPRLADELARHGIDPLQARRSDGPLQPAQLSGRRAALVAAGENLGFAAGCNLGLAVAQAADLPICVFLNNDTIVEAQALDRIAERLQRQDCFVCLPMLTIYGTDRIWNCGGTVYSAGFRRYHLANRPRREGEAAGEIRCSFFTGCCLAVSTDRFAARGGFSERFFFGEEDFELALWMKDQGLSAVCLTAAVVQHKVSVSFDRAAAGRRYTKAFVYYLNRFIHMRLRLGRGRWDAWVAVFLPYAIVLLVHKRLVGLREAPGFVRSLLRRAVGMDRVTRADFEELMRGQIEP
jgi:GT2 family glycosyltransferase